MARVPRQLTSGAARGKVIRPGESGYGPDADQLRSRGRGGAHNIASPRAHSEHFTEWDRDSFNLPPRQTPEGVRRVLGTSGPGYRVYRAATKEENRGALIAGGTALTAGGGILALDQHASRKRRAHFEQRRRERARTAGGRTTTAKSAGDEMPYKSDRQRRFMHARHPGIAQRWDAEIRESRKQPSYGGSGGHGRKQNVDKRGPAVAATAHRVAPRTFNRAAGTGNVRLINSRQKQDVFPMRDVVAPGRPTFRGQAPGSGHAARGAERPNLNLLIGPRSAPKGPSSTPGVTRRRPPPRTTQDEVRSFGGGRAAALQAQRQADAPRRAAQSYGLGNAARTAPESAPEVAGPSLLRRHRRNIAVGGTGIAAGGYGASRYELTAKAFRSNDPEAARQRRLGAGVATTGIIGTALAGAGGRRAYKLTRALRSAPTKLPARSQITDEQARALETLKHGRVVVADRKALALVGGGSATGLGSAALAHHARDDRNRRWA